jgi:hypothetical protein
MKFSIAAKFLLVLVMLVVATLAVPSTNQGLSERAFNSGDLVERDGNIVERVILFHRYFSQS